MRFVWITIGILLLLYIAYKSYSTASVDKNLYTLITHGAVILDVRTKGEFEGGHINNAVNIPLSKLHQGSIPLDTNQVIITCCSHGLRSIKAVTVLKSRGYKKAYNGGGWTELQFSVPQKLN